MLTELLCATAMVLLTVLIHAVGLHLLGVRLRTAIERHSAVSNHPLSFSGLVLTCGVVLGLFALHSMEIWCYAAFYRAVGALPELRDAVYFATMTYSTLGYDDEGIREGWKLVAAIEGVNGLLLIGWSTAFFVTIMTRLSRH